MNPAWNCKQVEPRLTDYALGAVSPEEEVAIQQHLENCDVCNEEAAHIAITLEIAADALEHDPRHAIAPARPAPLAALLGAVRSWIDAPENRPLSAAEWPGFLARAAIVILLPAALFFGILIPGLHRAWTDLRAGPEVASSESPVGTSETVILVNLLESPSVIEPEAIASLQQVAPQGISSEPTAALPDEGFEVWNADALAMEQLPLGQWYRAGTNEQRVELARSTMPILALRIAKTNSNILAGAPVATSHARPKSDGKPRLVDTLARPPGPTNRALLEPIRPQAPATK